MAPEGAEAARSLQKALLNEYARIGDPAVKLALLTRERGRKRATRYNPSTRGSYSVSAGM